MQLNNYLNSKMRFVGALSLLIGLTSCGSYQYVGYEDDGIYGSNQRTVERTEAVVIEKQNNDSDYYKNYFNEKSQELEIYGDDAIFTDIDSYQSNYVDNDSLNYQGNAGWGYAHNDNATITIHNNRPWNYGFWGDWSWGFNNSPYYWSYGGIYDPYWCPPYYNSYWGRPYWGYRYYYPYYNRYNNYYYGGNYYNTYNRRSLAYNSGRRGAIYSNSNSITSRRNLTSRSITSRRSAINNRSRTTLNSSRRSATRVNSSSRTRPRSYSQPRTNTRQRSTTTTTRSRRSNNNSSSYNRSSSSSRSSGNVRSTRSSTRSSSSGSSGRRSTRKNNI